MHTVSVYRETPEGTEIEIKAESDGRRVTGAWLPGSNDPVDLTPDEQERACYAAQDAAEDEAESSDYWAEKAWELRNDR